MSFNLNYEIARWRSQMLARESISSENVRELETHLRDTVSNLTASNLTEEEAFWLAVRRLGPTEQLTEEFSKDDPTAKWRTRIFWMATALFAFRFLSTMLNRLFYWLETSATTTALEVEASHFWLQFLAVIKPFALLIAASVLAWGLLSSRWIELSDKLLQLTSSRKVVAALVFIPLFIIMWLDLVMVWQTTYYLSSRTLANGLRVYVSRLPGVLANISWFAVLGLTVYLLAPGRRTKAAE